MMRLISALCLLGWFSFAHAAPELTVSIGHTTRDTLVFTRDAKVTSLTMTVAGSSRTTAVDKKKYNDWLERFRTFRRKGLALKDHRPGCARMVTFKKGILPTIPICYDRNEKLDQEIATLWREVRRKVGEK